MKLAMIGAGIGVLLAAALSPAAVSGGCLNDGRLGPRTVVASRPSFLFVTPEERRPLAAGSKLVLVRGDVPEPGAEALAEVVAQGYRRIVGELGVGGFPDRVSVSFADLGNGSDGYITYAPRGNAAEIVLHQGLSGLALVRALAHQVGHLAGLGGGREPASWLQEATAAWIEARLARNGDGSTAPWTRLGDPGSSFLAGTDRDRGGASWLAFLESRYGGDVVRRIWDEAAMTPGDNAVKAMESVLTAAGTSLRGEVEAYAAWLVAVSRRELAAGREAALAYAVDSGTFPLRGHLTESGPEQLATVYLHLDARDLAGGLRIEIVADRQGEWTASAVVVPNGSFVPTARVSFARPVDGRAVLAVPTSGISEIVVAVSNLGSGRLGLSYQVTSDERYPFVLRRLVATPDAGGVHLVWQTESEERVQGWSVLRSPAAAVEFSPITQVLVPGAAALGVSGGIEYSFTDGDVESGRTYLYYVEALTRDGLAAPSHVVSVSVR